MLGLPVQMVKESGAGKRATQGFETEEQQLLGHSGQQQQQDGPVNPAGNQLRGVVGPAATICALRSCAVWASSVMSAASGRLCQ